MSTSRELWLQVVAGGGRWKVRELATLLCDDVADVRGRLNRMVTARSVVKYGDAQDESVSYGVTRDCIVPMGVSIDDLIALDIGAEKLKQAMQWRPV
jgi:hypothetical protein